MRYGIAALLMLVWSAGVAAAQVISFGPVSSAQQVRMTADDVIARLMQFDRNRDLKLAIDELPERLQVLVVRGDRTDDLMLDAREIRGLTLAGPQPTILFRSPQPGIYGFGDAFGTLSSRTHIENSIDDLRLASPAASEAKRVASEFADVMEGAAHAEPGKVPQLDDARRAELVARLRGLLTEEEADNLRAALARRPLVKRDNSLLVRTLPAPRKIETVKKE